MIMFLLLNNKNNYLNITYILYLIFIIKDKLPFRIIFLLLNFCCSFVICYI